MSGAAESAHLFVLIGTEVVTEQLGRGYVLVAGQAVAYGFVSRGCGLPSQSHDVIDM
jgi:hypothetical protein